MFRSLVSLLLIAGLNTAPVSTTSTVDQFDMATLLNIKPIPITKEEAKKPYIGARASLVMDVDTGIVLYQKSPLKRLPMASLTKIMTAILILESHSLNEVVTVKDNFNKMTENEIGVKIWLKQNEKITVKNLLIGLLVRSGGDAAIALAKHHSETVDDFVKEMNKKAKTLNLTNTHFAGPIGMDNPKQYSSAFDLAILAKYALRDEDFRNIVKMPEATITSVDGKIKHTFKGTNRLLVNKEGLNIRGVKTGTTLGAGQSLINLARNKNGKEIIVVLLNSPARFTESKRLIKWSFDNFTW